ncbi:MAG: UvrD-helicase domain-containing protein [Prolixibacteraceae bacterium]|nr:UvrD-helicase domain-containing protein [Prolixibacteraceae bacterium]
MEFTSEQKTIFQFVSQESGHGIIDAVAGAGKTTTIMECATFVKDKSTILFCAFNNSISNEIARRFLKLGLNEVTVKTIHALGRQILQDNNTSGRPITLEEDKYKELIKSKEIQEKLRIHFEEILKINGFEVDEFDDRKNFAANNLVNKINSRLLDINFKYRATLTKEELSEFESLIIHFGIFNEIEVAKKNFNEELKAYFECHKLLLEAGNELSRKTMIIDFTDMLYLPYKWNQQPTRRYEFLFIDECQDLSKSQFAVAAKYGKKDGRILAVGDPSQSIYGFTGADINSFFRVKEYTKALQLPLTICFRCPKKVIELAQTIREDIVGNKEEVGILDTILFDDVINLTKPGDLIISRLRAPIVLMVFSFIDKNIKVQIHGDEVREIISEIKNIFKQNELNVVISTLSDEFNELELEVKKRWKWIISKNAERIIDNTERNLYIDNENNYLDRKLEFLHKKYEQWKNDCDTLNDIIRKIKEFISATENSIKLSTIHRAKGLENERVFILNYDELPYYRLQQKDWERTQELNLKYVAITRALKELYLVETKKIDILEDEESLFDNLPFD